MEAENFIPQQENEEDASIWPRDHFTFFRSYYDAIKKLPKKDRADTILAVCEYAIYGKKLEKMTDVAEAMFILIRPVIDSGIKKAESGSKGGKANSKQEGSKPKAKKKQSSRDKEKEVEVDREKDIEDDYEVEVDAENEAPLENADAEDRRLQIMRGELGRGVIALSNAQIAGLLDKMGLEVFDHYIEKLADFIIRTGAKPKSHYETILKWWREDSRVEP